MQFQSRWRNATYVIRRSRVVYHEGLGKEILPGLLAKFRGNQRLFDSQAAQIQGEWTDEERELVENKLLGHKDFGRGLYLAPGENLPEEKIEFVKDKASLTKAKVRCQNIKTEGGEIVQCPDTAQLGSHFCAEHDPDVQRITKGMLTSDGSVDPEVPKSDYASAGPLGD